MIWYEPVPHLYDVFHQFASETSEIIFFCTCIGGGGADAIHTKRKSCENVHQRNAPCFLLKFMIKRQIDKSKDHKAFIYHNDKTSY